MKRSNLLLMPVTIIASILIIGILYSFLPVALEDIKTEERQLQAFTKVESSVGATIYLTQTNDHKVKIEAKESILKILETEVSGNVLHIKFSKNDVRDTGPITIYLSMKEVAAFGLAGSGNVYAKEVVNSNVLELSIAGSGNIDFSKLTANGVKTSIAGSGKVFLTGNAANKSEISISGSGNIEAFNFPVPVTKISISGSGNCNVNVTKKLEASLAGSGKVYYKGNPVIDTEVSGSGKVISAN